MRAVYDQQIQNARAVRSFVADIPSSQLGTVESGHQMRRAAATSCRDLLASARAELQKQKDVGDAKAQHVTSILPVSGYRSASQQFQAWQGAFPRYYSETRSRRTAMSTGEHGSEAVTFLARYIGGILAAPGYSLHNDGRAMDYGTSESGRTLGPQRSDYDAWLQSWLWTWMRSNAATYYFYQNTSIREPWHWEYRAPITSSESDNETEAVPEGREELHNVTLLRGHRGTQPDLILRWNALPDQPVELDVVVHFHGYSDERDQMSLVRHKEPNSGLDWSDPDSRTIALGRQRPTLGLLPRGNYFGGNSGKGYNFPHLVSTGGTQALIDFALQHFARGKGLLNVRRGRLVVTGHSGGGSALAQVVDALNPDEVHVFDGLYSDPGGLIRWMQRKIRRDVAALEDGTGRNPQQYMPTLGGALRVFYRTDSGTAALSRKVQRELRQELLAISGASSIITSWYRVEQTSVPHGRIPRRYGWRLLTDGASNMPEIIGQ